MNYSNGLVLIGGIDKTSNIESYQIDNNRIKIKFNNNNKTYHYGRDKVTVDTFLNEYTIKENEAVIYNSTKLFNVIKVIKFRIHSLLILNNNDRNLVNNREMKIIDNTTETELLQYFKNIAQSIESAKENDFCSILNKAFSKIDVLQSNSALCQYLNRTSISKSFINIDNILFPFNFNISQRKATISAFESSISVIEGPPGTGKTQTILNIIANAIINGKTVGVVSNNNDAFLNVKEKLDKYGYGFLCAPLGKKTNIEQFFNEIEKYKVPSKIEEWRLESSKTLKLEKEVKTLQNALSSHLENINKHAKLKLELNNHLVEQKHFEDLVSSRNLGQIKDLSLFRLSEERITNFLVDNEKYVSNNNKISIVNKLKFFIKYGFRNFNALSNKNDDIILFLQKKYYELKIERIKNEITILDKKNNSSRIKNKSERLGKISKELFRGKVYTQMQGKRSVNDFSIGNYKSNFTEFMNRFPVILSTTHSLRNSVNTSELLDYLIIDEASQSDLLSASLALTCAENIVVVGDLKQLPNIVSEKVSKIFNKKFSSEKVIYEYDYFNQSILSSIKNVYGKKIPMNLLREHYRCNSDIIQFCNKKFYDGELIPLSSNDSENPLVVYRSQPGNHSREIKQGNKGFYNQREIDIVEEFLNNENFDDEAFKNIGFVSPFKKQVCKANSNLNSEIEKNTVHKYQGREKDIIVFSTVLDTNKSSGRLIKFVDNPNLINVAVSRAINKFILVTDQDVFLKKGKNIGDLIRYIEYLYPENIIESETVSVFDLLYKEYSEKLHSFKNKVKNQLKYESENIMYALLQDILTSPEFESYNFKYQIRLSNLVKLEEAQNKREIEFLNHHQTSVDFVIYNKFNNEPALIIEVDGVKYHEANPVQLKRDKIKNKLIRKSKITLLRLPTNGSGEKQKIVMKLRELTVSDTISQERK